MKTVPFNSTANKAYGEPIKPVAYSGTVDQFENAAEVREAGEWPSDADITDFVNRNRLANERTKAMNAALKAAGYEKPTLEDPKVQFNTIVKALLARG